jgi:Domain of unknown function (DUF1877)
MGMICEVFLVPARVAADLLADPGRIRKVLKSLQGTDAGISLEKSWHGLHFALTQSAWGGRPPLNVLATGGTPVGTTDVGYGPARLVDPAGVMDLHAALSAYSDADFERHFDPERLEEQAIYPQIWDEPLEDLLDEFGEYLQQLKAHVRRAAETGQALLIVNW